MRILELANCNNDTWGACKKYQFGPPLLHLHLGMGRQKQWPFIIIELQGVLDNGTLCVCVCVCV